MDDCGLIGSVFCVTGPQIGGMAEQPRGGGTSGA